MCIYPPPPDIENTSTCEAIFSDITDDPAIDLAVSNGIDNMCSKITGYFSEPLPC